MGRSGDHVGWDGTNGKGGEGQWCMFPSLPPPPCSPSPPPRPASAYPMQARLLQRSRHISALTGSVLLAGSLTGELATSAPSREVPFSQ